jgi:hypothetical protein
MSAPKRTELPTKRVAYPATFWEIPGPPQQHFINKVLASPGAKKAFQRLKAGVGEDVLWVRLWSAALVKLGQMVLASRKKRVTQRSRALRRGLPGFPAYSLRRFPDRVRRMAQKIETLNRQLRSSEYRGLANISNFNLSELDLVPAQLRLYASCVDSLNGFRTALRKRRMGLGLAHSVPLEIALEVRSAMPKSSWNDIASLLTAAYYAIGSETEVDPKALNMLYIRYTLRNK